MSNLWWLQEGWTETRCGHCGAKIWPEGDPDHGLCFSCFNAQWHADQEAQRWRDLEEQRNRELEEEYHREMERIHGVPQG